MSRDADKAAPLARLLSWKSASRPTGGPRHRRGTIADIRRDQGRPRFPGITASVALVGAGLSIGVVVGVGMAGQMRQVAHVTEAEKPTPASSATKKVVVPSWRITQPLNLPPPATITESTEAGAPAPVAAELARLGVPVVAMSAYQRAAEDLRTAEPECGLHWSHLAAIGRIETNHGRFGGAQLRTDGTTTVPIRGPQLNGPPFARITDTDNGVFDGDTSFDRAVGPMQFIPSTWRLVWRDGNDDGRADPDNMFDAALSAGVLLCSGGASLASDDGLRAAALRYNHSSAYADLVVSLARSYRVDGVSVVEEAIPGVDTSVPPAQGQTVLADAFSRSESSANLTSARSEAPTSDRSQSESSGQATTTSSTGNTASVETESVTPSSEAGTSQSEGATSLQTSESGSPVQNPTSEPGVVAELLAPAVSGLVEILN